MSMTKASELQSTVNRFNDLCCYKKGEANYIEINSYYAKFPSVIRNKWYEVTTHGGKVLLTGQLKVGEAISFVKGMLAARTLYD